MYDNASGRASLPLNRIKTIMKLDDTMTVGVAFSAHRRTRIALTVALWGVLTVPHRQGVPSASRQGMRSLRGRVDVACVAGCSPAQAQYSSRTLLARVCDGVGLGVERSGVV